MNERMALLLPTTAKVGLRKTWAATIDFTPDHLPILGPALGADGVLDGTVVAAAGGHGMMWGPGVARAAADLALTGTTDVVDVSDLGLDRFDEHGRSRLDPDPIALPFPDARTRRPPTPHADSAQRRNELTPSRRKEAARSRRVGANRRRDHAESAGDNSA